jgi:hypothetical protein
VADDSLVSLHEASAVRLWLSLRFCQKFRGTPLELRLLAAKLRSDNKGWRGVWPSSRLTTFDIFGLSVGAAVVHSRATFNIRSASSVE